MPNSFVRRIRKSVSVFIAMTGLIVVALLVAKTPRRYESRNDQPKNAIHSSASRVRPKFGSLPLAFERNEGQTDAAVKYMARGQGYKLYLTSSEAILAVRKRGQASEVMSMIQDKRLGAAKVKSMLRQRQEMKAASPTAVVRMEMLGGNPQVGLSAAAPESGKVNYFIGNDPSKWHSNIPLYGRVSYKNLYPGVDLAFHGAAQQLEFDYVVSPGADPGLIAVGFRGASKMSTTAAGDLVLDTAAGPVEMHRPVAYQEKGGARENVEARFEVRNPNEVAFSLGPYDHNRELVIDPTITYSTYFGGSLADYGSAITTDTNGNAYIAGASDSATLPGDSSGTGDQSNIDAFVTEISSSGTLVSTTLFGGSADQFPGGIAVDTSGNIYVSGTTDSSDFPVTGGAAQPTFLGGVTRGDNDAFAVKLAPQGASITWATYIGGSDSDSGLAIAIDSSLNVYVVGETFSTNLGGTTGGVNPLPNGSAVNLGEGTGDDDGYIVKLNPTGTAYLLVSYLGGSSGDLATGVALDPAGNIYVSGETISTDLPTTPGVVQTHCGTDGTCNASNGNVFDDAFVFAIQSSLAGYEYVTYYGGSNVDDAQGIAADSSGDAYFTGNTASTDFETVGTPFQSSLAGTQNAFAVELNPAGTAALYGTYLGGNGTDIGLGITLDSFDNIYITGQTNSTQTAPGAFPLVNPYQPAFGGSTDAFITVLSPTQGMGLFSTYLGGGGDEDQAGGAIALDSSRNIYVTGDTDSGNGSTAVFPTKSVIDGTYGGGTCLPLSGTTSVPCPDAFIAAYTTATAPDFILAASTPTAVSAGTSGMSTVSLTALNAYSSPVNLTCSVTGTGSPLPACSSASFSTNPLTPGSASSPATSTLTITTTAATSALSRPSKFFYASWLPMIGLSLAGMSFGSTRRRRKQLLGLLMIGMVMTGLLILPACGGSSNKGGGGGGGGGTPAGSYTVTITGTGTDSQSVTHSTTVTLTVN